MVVGSAFRAPFAALDVETLPDEAYTWIGALAD